MYIFTLIFFPIWLIQAFYLKKTAVRLPEAKGERLLNEEKSKRQYLILGDSVAAGVGVEYIGDALAGHILQLANEHIKGDVSWQVLAKSGDKLSDLITQYKSCPSIVASHVVISIGVNDVTSFTSTKKWKTQLTELFDLIVSRNPACQIVLIAVPDMGQFPLLKWPLNQVFSWRSKKINRKSISCITSYSQVIFQSIDVSAEPKHFASDGYHPSSLSCKMLAQEIIRKFD